MGFILKVLATAVAVYLTALLLPGVSLQGVQTAVIVALVLAFLNAIVKPLLIVLTLPVTVLTLGLFLLVINILIVKLADSIVDGFAVRGWFTALLFSFIVSFISAVLNGIVGEKK